jgi:hypothetical protein
MRKLAALLVLGGLALGLPARAMATEIVSLACYDLNSNPSVAGQVMGSKASSGFARPASCVVPVVGTPPPCAQCIADLLNAGFTMAFVQVNPTGSIGSLTYLFKK